MVPDVLFLTAALTMLFLVPVMARQALSLPRVVAVSYGGTVVLLGLLWLGWVLLSWNGPQR